MSERHERPMYEGKRQRGPDRRKSNRRTSDSIVSWVKYIAIAFIAGALAKYLL